MKNNSKHLWQCTYYSWAIKNNYIQAAKHIPQPLKGKAKAFESTIGIVPNCISIVKE